MIQIHRLSPAFLAAAGIATCALGCAPAPEHESASWPAEGRAIQGEEQGARVESTPAASALLVPGGHAAVCWLPDGSFWTGDVAIRLLWMDGSPVSFAAKEAIEPGVPIYRSTAERDSVRIEAVAVAPWAGGSFDSLVVCDVTLRLETTGIGARDVALFAEVAAGGGPHHVLHPEAALQDSFVYRIRGRDLRRNGDVVLRIGAGWTGDLAAWTGTAPVAYNRWVRFASGAARLHPGRPVAWRLWIPARPGKLPSWAAPGSPAAIAVRTRAAWRDLLARGAHIQVPDPSVQAVLDASHAVVLACFEAQPDGTLLAIGNPMQYRDFYLRDGARHLRALDLLGHHELAGSLLDRMFEFQWPPGAFISQRGQLDGTGQTLWALDQHLALSGDSVRAARYLPAALAAARWVERMRKYSRLRGGPAAGLLPYSDPRDNELLEGHLLGTDAWAVAGLRSVAAVCESLGRADEAAHWDREAAEYADRLRTVWAREAVRQARPLPPAVERGAREWGNVSAAYPLAVLDPEDPHFAAFAAWYRRGAFRSGLPTSASPDSLHHYLGFDLTQSALRAGQREQVWADLQAEVEFTQADGTGFEVLHAEDRGYARNLPPHVTFASMYVDLVRSMLLYERGDSLVLLGGVPASWLEGAGPIVVRSAPTRFGRVSLRVGATESGGISLHAELPAAAVVAWPMPVLETGPGGAGQKTRFSTLPAGASARDVRLAAE